MNPQPLPRIIFITGTGTGVGKTLLTALLLKHLQPRERVTLALKPFCSGTRDDAHLLHSLQHGQLTLEEINPFFFSAPLAPWVAARQQNRRIPLQAVLAHIESICLRHRDLSCLLLEGVGGLLVPLGREYTILDLIQALRCEVLVVSANMLGTLNHTLLTVRAFAQAQKSAARLARSGPSMLSRIVLMNLPRPDSSAASNPRILAELLKPLGVVTLPWLGPQASTVAGIEKNEKKFQKTLARILQ